MIKVQQGLNFCLNPACPQQFMRSFDPTQPHAHTNCTKWFISEQQLSHQASSYTISQLKQIKVDFENQPVLSMQVLESLGHSPWEKLIDSEESMTKKELVKAIQWQFEGLREQIRNFIQAGKILSSIRNKIHQPHALSELVNEHFERQLPTIEALGKRQLFPKNCSKDRIRKVKEEFGALFENKRDPQPFMATLLTQTELKKFKDFVFEGGENLYSKIQQLSTALGLPIPMYQIKTERIQLNCPICEKHITRDVTPVNKKGVKKQIAQSILVHIYWSHQEEAGYAHSHKINKTHLLPLTFEEVIKESAGFKEVLLVDRQSGAGGNYPYLQARQHPSRFVLEVLTAKHELMARSRHLAVELGESVDLMIAIISYVCTQRDQDVYLLTNRPSLQRGIENMMFCKSSGL